MRTILLCYRPRVFAHHGGHFFISSTPLYHRMMTLVLSFRDERFGHLSRKCRTPARGRREAGVRGWREGGTHTRRGIQPLIGYMVSVALSTIRGQGASPGLLRPCRWRL